MPYDWRLKLLSVGLWTAVPFRSRKPKFLRDGYARLSKGFIE